MLAIFINLIEIDDGQRGIGEKIPRLFQILDNILGGDVSQRRGDKMKRLFPDRLAA